jgi:molybdopterin converting factor small subunit
MAEAPAEEARAPALVRLGTLLTIHFPDAPRLVPLQAASVAEMIEALERRFPGMRDCICDSTPAIRRHMNVFVDGKRATLDTPLAPGADVYILTAVSGG